VSYSAVGVGVNSGLLEEEDTGRGYRGIERRAISLWHMW